LGIRVSTVTTYWVRIRSKVGQLNRAELIALCVRQKSQEAVTELRNEVMKLRAENSDLAKVAATSGKRAEIGLAALDEVPCGVIVARSDGTFLMSNKPACDLLGYEEDDLEDAALGDILPAPHNAPAPMAPRVVSACRQDGSRVALKVEIKRFSHDQSLLLCVMSASHG
jgi:PAS domain-containing protein